MKRRSIIALVLALLLAASGPAAAQEAARVSDKEEVVYANLNAAGETAEVYVVNQFIVEQGGLLTDYGDYTNTRNLTSTEALALGGGEVSVAVDEGNFFYQGNMESTGLPWRVEIYYALDSATVSAAEIAGQSGEFALRVRTTPDEAYDAAFTDNYVLQATVTLDGEKFKNIVAEGATVANAGKSKTIAFTVLPGEPGDLRITATVTDFSMDGVQIAAMPFSMDVKDAVDTDTFKEQLVELQDGIKELNDGTQELSEGVSELADGMGELADGSGDLKKGLTELKKGAGTLSDNSGSILKGIEQLADGLGQLRAAGEPLKTGTDGLVQGAKGLYDGLGALDDQFSQLVAGVETVYESIKGLHDLAASSQGDIANLEKLMGVLDDYPDIQKDFSKYIGSAKSLIGTSRTLESSLGALKTSYKEILSGLKEAGGGISQLKSAAKQIKDGIEAYAGGAGQFIDGVLAVDASPLAKSYAQFDKGLGEIADGIKTLSDNYGKIDDALAEVKDGMAELADGTGELADGTGTLQEETSNLDVRVDEEIDSALSKFTGEGFSPVSFTDARNEVSLVQFVLQSEAIEASEIEAAAQEEAREDGFLDKLRRLFVEEEE